MSTTEAIRSHPAFAALSSDAKAQVVLSAPAAADPFSEERLTMGYGQERLTAVFDLVADPENWKMPVDAFVEEGQATVGEIEAAVIFFTGSVPDIYPCEASGGRQGYAVLAAGYYEAVGA